MSIARRIMMKLALLAAAATVLAASPAIAHDAGHATPSAPPERGGYAITLHDGPGDVWTYSDTTSGYQPAVQPAADVLRARVVHGRYAVRVRLYFDDLTRVNTQWYRCEIHTPGVTSWFILEATRHHWRGIAFQDVEGEWVRVPGVDHTIDYAADVVTLRVPRTLLGSPPWVRVRLRNDLGVGGGTFFTDNPTTASTDAVFTPRLQPR
jgi:hypothetical protein